MLATEMPIMQSDVKLCHGKLINFRIPSTAINSSRACVYIVVPVSIWHMHIILANSNPVSMIGPGGAVAENWMF